MRLNKLPLNSKNIQKLNYWFGEFGRYKKTFQCVHLLIMLTNWILEILVLVLLVRLNFLHNIKRNKIIFFFCQVEFIKLHNYQAAKIQILKHLLSLVTKNSRWQMIIYSFMQINLKQFEITINFTRRKNCG